MHAPRLRCLAAAAVLAFALPASAEDPAGCDVAEAERNPLAERAERLEQLARLPPQCLKEIVRACSSAAQNTLLDLGSAASCSIGYEALLQTGFGGDFQALLAWWRTARAGGRSN